MTPRGQIRVHQQPSQFLALTGLRALAALGVLFCHFSEIDTKKNVYFYWGPLNPLLIHGAIGVDVFFVLSGFILSYVYREQFSSTLKLADVTRFMTYRFARLYPVHIATMATMLAIYVVGLKMGTLPHHGNAFSPASIAANLLMVHAWFPREVAAMNGPAWSISAEWFAYLLFPLACFLLQRAPRYWPWVVIALSAVIMFRIPTISALGEIALEFPVGMATFEIHSRLSKQPARWGSIIAMLAIVWSTFWLSSTDAISNDPIHVGGHLRMGVMLSTSFLLICLTNPSDMLGRLLSLPAFVYAGEISYSVYMCHWPVWTVFHKGTAYIASGRNLPHWALMLSVAVVTVVVSIVCYHFIELPGRALIRKARPRKIEKSEGSAVQPELPVGQHDIARTSEAI